MVDVLNEGAIALMTSIGHRTGLFDAMAGLPPSTSEQIATAAGLKERYVREWLAAMVVGRIVEHNPEDETYYLPQEHAAFLTRVASPDNIAVTAQLIPLMGSVEDSIVESFKNGGGVPYSAFPRFHEVMAEDSGQTVVAALTDHILPLVPGLIERLESGIEVLDVGCGSGRALNLMARMFPNSRFVGYDFSEEAIARARTEAKEHGTTNARFEVKDAAVLDEKARYDLITTFRCDPRSGRPGGRAKRYSRHPQRGRGLPDAGHCRLQSPAQQPRSPYSSLALHRLDHALHDGLAGARWRRLGHDVGRRESQGDARGGWLQEGGG
jgi:SAM-dependent methyltransferase